MQFPLHRLLPQLGRLSENRSASASAAAMLIFLFTWQLITFRSSITPAAAPAKAETLSKETHHTPSQELLLLFQTNAPITTTPKQVELPESNLALQISAIFFSGTTEHSTAVLEDGDKTLILKAGEEIRPNVTIERIDSTQITIKRNAKLEILSLKGFEDHSMKNSAQREQAIAHKPNKINNTQKTTSAYQKFIHRKLAQNQ